MADVPESRIYLDNNATTPVDKRVLEGMLPFLSEYYGNPASRDHAFGWDAAEAIEEARYHVANLINAKPNEIVFTSGATESINLSLKGFAHARRGNLQGIMTSSIEHEAVLESCQQLKAQTGIGVTYLPVDSSGRLDLSAWSRSMRGAEAMLVSLMLANNEIGVINPIRDIAAIAHEISAVFFTDMTQAVGKIPIDVRVENIDLAAFSAHKIYGPKGVGALFIRGGGRTITLEPLLAGGGQEQGLRSGTVNVAGIVGFGEACRIAQLELHEEAERIRQLRDKLEESLLTALPDLWINGDRVNRLPNTSNIMFAGVDARALIRDMYSIAVATRSACSSGATGPSHVLKALGLSDEQAYASVRFSLGRFTTVEEIDTAIERVVSSVRKLRSHQAVGEGHKT